MSYRSNFSNKSLNQTQSMALLSSQKIKHINYWLSRDCIISCVYSISWCEVVQATTQCSVVVFSLQENRLYHELETLGSYIMFRSSIPRVASIHHFFRNACTKSGSLRFSQFSGCWLILSVYIIMSFDFSFVRLFGVR